MYEDLYQAIRLRFGDVNASQSMGDWISSNTTIKSRPFSYEHYAFQKAIADDMHGNLTVKKCSQIGLPGALDTPIPTPNGWTTMGDIEVGERVFTPTGEAVEVVYKSPIYHERLCFRVTFDDGTSIVTDEHHRWPVDCYRAFHPERGVDRVGAREGRPLKSEGYTKSGIVSTGVMAKRFKLGERNLYSIRNTAPLQTPPVSLPVDPYYLGVLLGDGTLSSGYVTSSNDDAEEMSKNLRAVGLQVDITRTPGRAATLRVAKSARLLSHKHVPDVYLRASIHQRESLLQGLLDTDGSITKSGRVSFHNTNPKLIEAVEELARSLGFKPNTRWRKPTPGTMKNGHVINSTKDIAEVSWVAYSDQPMFRLKRKLERQKPRGAGRPNENFRRYITNIEPVESVPVQCLMVDHDDHLFLWGRGMVPTHNTEVQIRKFLAILTRNDALAGMFTFPTERMRDSTYNGRIKPILEQDDVFNPPSSTKPIRSKKQIQIRQSFGYISGCTEGDATNTSADFLFHDELDLSPQEIVALYQSRLQGSDMQMTQAFSTPTFHGFGISKRYEMTDQREYVVRCDSCRHVQIPRFEPKFIFLKDFKYDVENFTDLTPEQISLLDLEDCHVRCEHCSARLDLGNPDLREWVATYPSRQNFRGYQVRPFSTSRIKPGYIFGQLAQYRKNEFIRGFYNTVLGEEYTAADARIQKEDLEIAFAKGTARIPEIDPNTPAFMGIDVGMTCHITISIDDQDGNPHFVLFDTVPSAYLADRVRELRKTYNIVQGAIDRFPYTEIANAIRDETQGLIMPVQYRGTAMLAPVKEQDTGVLSHYSANSTLLLDRMQAVIGHKQIIFSGYQGQKETVITHMTDMIRNEKPGEQVQAEWVKTNNQDHYFHSGALNLLCRRISEHMFTHQISTIHTSSSFMGAEFGSGGGLGFNPATDKSLAKISRFC